MTPSIMIVSIIFFGISVLVSAIMKSRFKAYGKIPLSSRLTGREVAEKMLRDSGIYDVQITSSQGFLSDHYNPATKTINLSPDVYNADSVAAAAVAAHETGHAIQHAQAYAWLQLRSKLVPAVQFSSSIVHWVLLIGLGMAMSGNTTLLLIGVILLAVTVVFSVITLPVEFDASRRALAWLNGSNVTTRNEYPYAKKALTWAAMTYVVAALASIASLAQYVFLLMGARNRE